MKIRFYHRWIYKLFYRVLDPVFQAHPYMVRQMRDHNQAWLDMYEAEVQKRRSTFHIVKKR